MIDKETLTQILLFQDLPEATLDKIAHEASLDDYPEGTLLFYQNRDLSDFYMLLSGQVVLKAQSPAGEILTLERVAPGSCFGFSAFMGESRSSFNGVCAEKCRIISISGERILQLCEQDGDLGYAFMLKVVKLFKSRMEKHTIYFLNSITNHPEIKAL